MSQKDAQFFIRLAKIKNNRLLSRVQMIANIFHPANVKVTKEQIKEKLRAQFKKQHISVFGMKKLYGGGRTKCFVLIYDSEDAMKKIEPQSRLNRMEMEKLPPKERKAQKKKEGRKVLKVKKYKVQRKRNSKRIQEFILAIKQKKKKN